MKLTLSSLILTALTVHAYVSNGFVVPPTSTSSSRALLSSPHVRNAHVRRSHSYEESPLTVFTRMDKDGNGKVDAQELCDYLVETGIYTDAVAKSIFSRLDRNRNGHIKLQQLERAMNQHNLLRTTTTTTDEEQDKAVEIPHKRAVKDPQRTFSVKSKKQPAQTRRNTKSKQPQNNNKKKLYYQQAKKFFDALAVNRDGFISFQELQQHFLVKRMEQVAQSSGLLIKRKIQQDQQVVKRKMEQDQKVVQRKIQEDQKVALEYSEAALRKLFAMIDRNSKGRISLQDLKEAFVRYPSVRNALKA